VKQSNNVHPATPTLRSDDQSRLIYSTALLLRNFWNTSLLILIFFVRLGTTERFIVTSCCRVSAAGICKGVF